MPEDFSARVENELRQLARGDNVLAIGAGISEAATQIPLTKPVVATFVQRPDFGRIHEQEGDRSSTEYPTRVEQALAGVLI